MRTSHQDHNNISTLLTSGSCCVMEPATGNVAMISGSIGGVGLGPGTGYIQDGILARLKEALGEHYVDLPGHSWPELVASAVRNLRHSASCSSALSKKLYEQLERLQKERDEARAERDRLAEEMKTLNAYAWRIRQAGCKK